MGFAVNLFFSLAFSVLCWFVLFPKSFGRHIGKIAYEIMKALP